MTTKTTKTISIMNKRLNIIINDDSIESRTDTIDHKVIVSSYSSRSWKFIFELPLSWVIRNKESEDNFRLLSLLIKCSDCRQQVCYEVNLWLRYSRSSFRIINHNRDNWLLLTIIFNLSGSLPSSNFISNTLSYYPGHPIDHDHTRLVVECAHLYKSLAFG